MITSVTYTAAGREYTTRLTGKYTIESAEKALNETIESGPERIVTSIEVMGSPVGRPPISAGDLTQRRTVTLRRSTLEKVERQRRKEESLSACIDRLLTEAK